MPALQWDAVVRVSLAAVSGLRGQFGHQAVLGVLRRPPPFSTADLACCKPGYLANTGLFGDAGIRPPLDVHGHAIKLYPAGVHGLLDMPGHLRRGQPLSKMQHEDLVGHTVQLESGLWHAVGVVEDTSAAPVSHGMPVGLADDRHVCHGPGALGGTVPLQKEHLQVDAAEKR